MIIPERLQVLANRYGNKCMIEKIFGMAMNKISDDYSLEGILPDRKGIIVVIDSIPTILLNDGIVYQSKPSKVIKKKTNKGDK